MPKKRTLSLQYLQVNHVSRERDLWVLSCVHNGYIGLLYLLLNKP